MNAYKLLRRLSNSRLHRAVLTLWLLHVAESLTANTTRMDQRSDELMRAPQVHLILGIFLALFSISISLTTIVIPDIIETFLKQFNLLFVIALISALWNYYTRRSYSTRHLVTILVGIVSSCGMLLPAILLRDAGPLAAGFIIYGITLLFTMVFAGAVYIAEVAIGTKVITPY